MSSTGSIAELVRSLTREEKLRLVHGAVDPDGEATGYVPGVERLGIPPLKLVDGPMGIRTNAQPATAFPASISLAASFDPDLARSFGTALAREAQAYGQDVVLAPGVNLVRVPHCGRSFEYFSEDPVVAGEFAASVVDGVQSEGVVAAAKHYVANNQERNRCGVSAEVDERTLRELYLRPFRRAVEAGTGSIMTAYNRVGGTYASDNRRLVTEILKGEWGFEGFVVSDWHGTGSTVGAANGGLDLEMPGVPATELFEGASADGFDPESFEPPDGIPDISRGGLFADPLDEAIDRGAVPEERLDDMVERVLGTMGRFGLLDGTARDDGAIDTPAHRALAERIAVRGTVLLENDGALPLPDDANVALIGPNVHEAKLGGGGSSEITPFRRTSPREGIESRADGAVEVARGVPEIAEPSLFDELPFDVGDGDGSPGEIEPIPTVNDAVATAERADVAVVFVRDAATEGRDRERLALPGGQDGLVDAVAEVADRTVVVVASSGPVELPWHDAVDAVLETWYPGQAHGRAIASVLYGDEDPSGRLPVTFAPEADYPATDPRQYPGVDGEAHYEEGLFIGYRHFDSAGIEPTYPFGHGESYATFEYGTATTVDERTVRVSVRNVGDRPGREVVQAYVRPPRRDGITRPARELAGFEPIHLEAGGTRDVEITLDERAVGRYDVEDGWTVDPGTYTVEVGRSVGDVRTTSTIET